MLYRKRKLTCVVSEKKNTLLMIKVTARSLSEVTRSPPKFHVFSLKKQILLACFLCLKSIPCLLSPEELYFMFGSLPKNLCQKKSIPPCVLSAPSQKSFLFFSSVLIFLWQPWFPSESALACPYFESGLILPYVAASFS